MGADKCHMELFKMVAVDVVSGLNSQLIDNCPDGTKNMQVMGHKPSNFILHTCEMFVDLCDQVFLCEI